MKRLPVLLVVVSCVFTCGYGQSTDVDSIAVPLDGAQLYTINDSLTFSYSRPSLFTHIARFPGDISVFTKNSFRRENLWTLGLVTASTALLIRFDQLILDETQRFGRRIGLDGNNRMKRAFHVFGFPIEVPRDWDTALYFIGDGWTNVGVFTSFLSYGLLKNSNRAVQTASQIAEGMITAGFVSQLLKHITGRESPYVSTRDGGRWDFFPDQIEYHKHVPRYDAFPSGHLAVGLSTVTIIAENYPEKRFIKPLGYTLLTVLSFEMVNNGVHWISDYPLSIAMGYAMGRIAVSRGRQRVVREPINKDTQRRKFTFLPTFTPETVGVRLYF